MKDQTHEIGLRVFEIRLIATDPAKNQEPYCLAVGPTDSRNVAAFAFGTRRDMRHLRTAILEAVRSDNATVERVASALAELARREMSKSYHH